MQHSDVVIIGAGIAGSALACMLGRRGMAVTVLERDLEPVDRVRGEYMTTWGVAEAARLELYDVFLRAGWYHTARLVPYDENTPLEQAEAAALNLSALLPGVAGPMCGSHPRLCRELAAAAAEHGATVLRGVQRIVVVPGVEPQVRWDCRGVSQQCTPRLVVVADGRNSPTRHQLGFELEQDPPHNLIGGMLVSGVPEWPEDAYSIGTQGQMMYYVFPQGAGRLRLYSCWNAGPKHRFGGAERREKLLRAFSELTCLRHSESIGRATPEGPFNAFSNEDHWVTDPTRPGVVLIGDAAGFTDPITGQGLSSALHDVRLVSDIVGEGDCSRHAFRPYVEQRTERMRRLRVTARLAATMRAEFGPAAAERRARVMARTRAGWPSPVMSAFLGPDELPAHCFDPAAVEALLAA